MSDQARLAAGDRAPDFSLASDEGGEVNLYDLLKQGRKVIVYFYPAAMTPGCTKQACDFTDSLDALQRRVHRVGISKDATTKLAKFRERDGLTITLLSDPELAVHRAYAPTARRSSTASSSRVSSAPPSSSTPTALSSSRSTTSRRPVTWPSSGGISDSRFRLPDPRPPGTAPAPSRT